MEPYSNGEVDGRQYAGSARVNPDEMTLDGTEVERLGEFGMAALVALGVFIALWVLRRAARLVARRVEPGAEAVSLRRLVERLVDRTSIVFRLAIAVFAGSLTLDLIEEVERAIRVTVVLIVVIQIGIWGNTTIRYVAARYQAKAGSEPAVIATVYGMSFVAMLVMWFVLVIVALDNMGVEVTALVAGLGIGGIAVALAAQSLLGDLLASLVIIIDRPFVVGDSIEVGGLMGTVEHIGVKTTRIRALSGEQLVFPNSDLVSSRIRNYRLMEERRIEFRFGLAYSTPPDLVERAPGMVREIIEEQVGVRFDRAHFRQLGDTSLIVEAVYFVLTPDYRAYMDIQQTINLAIVRELQDAVMGFALPPWAVPLEPGHAAGREIARPATRPDAAS